MYVELEGELDPSIKKVFIEVTHLGNNKFYFSDKSHVELIQEKPKSVLMIMETNNLTEEKCKSMSIHSLHFLLHQYEFLTLKGLRGGGHFDPLRFFLDNSKTGEDFQQNFLVYNI